MGQRLDRILDSQSTVYAVCGFTLALGLFFIFIWAPHPWGWDGFDHYDQLAWALAQGRPFPTLEVPWGYAYFVAIFYRAFGHHPWIPLVAQAALNACLPQIVFLFASTWLDRSTSVLAAVLVGLFSFNTVYASTLSSDAICTVIFMTMLVAFATARRRDRWPWYAIAGLLAGVASQLRPNLMLIAPLLALFVVAQRQTTHRLAKAVALLLAAAVTVAPWVVHGYRLTRVVLPTSVHGSVQLWYGSLQVGPYLRRGAYNPRRIFEEPVFAYTSLQQDSIVVTADVNDCGRGWPSATTLVFWTDRDAERRRLASRASRPRENTLTFEIPAVGRSAVVYYYLETTWRSDRGNLLQITPPDGSSAPFVYFISHDHLGDLDVRGDLLDIFDLVRIVRTRVWAEPLPFAQQLAAAGIGATDVEAAAGALVRSMRHGDQYARPIVVSIDRDGNQARVALSDGSSIEIPRAWNASITDVSLKGPLAIGLLRSHVSLASLARGGPGRHDDPTSAPPQGCLGLEEIALNQVFYRHEVDMMRRYSALALDNIRREPWAFARASIYRMYRLFVIEGSDDLYSVQQFQAGSAVFALATGASMIYLMLFIAGVALAWNRGYAITLPLLLIAYVPLTIAVVLTNMRYSITVQPLLLTFIAVALRPHSQPRRQ